MAIETIEIKSQEEWLQQRAKDVTSTEVSALYGLSPYLTEFELFHNKRDQVVVRLEPNERMKWGNRLEAAIAHGAAEDQGWDISKFNVYMRDMDARIGSSFDFQINSKSAGPSLQQRQLLWPRRSDKACRRCVAMLALDLMLAPGRRCLRLPLCRCVVLMP